MIAGSVMALVAAGFVGVGVYAIRTGRAPGPTWLWSARREVPPWRTGVAVVVLGVCSILCAVAMFLGTTWAPLLGWLVTGAGLVFATTLREYEPNKEKRRLRRAWYRLAPTADATDSTHASGSEE